MWTKEEKAEEKREIDGLELDSLNKRELCLNRERTQKLMLKTVHTYA